jgi:hypothetical protein
VSVSSDGKPPDLLIVLQLKADVGFAEVYNGPFPTDLWNRKSASKRRVKSLRVHELKVLNQSMLRQKHHLDNLNALFATTDGAVVG